ncbi:MAG: FAD-dependent oxidoreductase [Propionibacteriales bacterium]|nr:FAD-dependent oxidoreductase [Propionibacteriales bacterium]
MAPRAARYVVVGAGIHGLSTAWHLARELRARGQDEPADVVVLDKTGVGGGASGIACGVVRNNYFQPAMRRLMAHSVSVWESDPAAFSYHPVGYLQLGPEAMRAGVRQIYQEQQAIGYRSTLVEGEADCRAYMGDLFPDWQAEGISCVLHEQQGGFANNRESLRGLAAKAEAAGVRIRTGVRVTGLDVRDGAVRAVVTDQGTIPCDHLVVAAGPWTRDLWAMLGLPDTVPVRGADGGLQDRAMWTYWLVQEGTLKVDPATFTDARGGPPPVVHVDSDAPLFDEDGEPVTAEPWGIYYKPDANFGGVQGGSLPRRIEEPTAEVAVDPYGPEQSAYTAGADFARLWTAGLAHCHGRFREARRLLSPEPSGGIGCFTPDSFPVFDHFLENAYVIADSNHGYKMIGVGALVAKELLGEPQELLAPFAFARYEQGRLHPTSSSPFPWS